MLRPGHLEAPLVVVIAPEGQYPRICAFGEPVEADPGCTLVVGEFYVSDSKGEPMKPGHEARHLDAYAVSGSSPPGMSGKQRAVVTDREREVRELLLQVVRPSVGTRPTLGVPDSASVGASATESGASEWLTVEQFAGSRDVHHQTVRKAIKDGRLRAENWGSGAKPLYRIPRDAVLAPVQGSTVAPSIPSGKRRSPSAGRFSFLLATSRPGVTSVVQP